MLTSLVTMYQLLLSRAQVITFLFKSNSCLLNDRIPSIYLLPLGDIETGAWSPKGSQHLDGHLNSEVLGFQPSVSSIIRPAPMPSSSIMLMYLFFLFYFGTAF